LIWLLAAILWLSLSSVQAQTSNSHPLLNSWNGGGRALDQDQSPSSNPATLYSLGRGTAWLGAADIAGERNFFSSWVFPVSTRGSAGISVYDLNLESPGDFRGSLAGSVVPWDALRVGGRGNFIQSASDLSFDLDLGVFARPNRHLGFGFTASSLTESLTDTLQMQNRRYGIGASWKYNEQGTWFHAWDAEMLEWKPTEAVHTLLSGIRLGDTQNFQLFCSVRGAFVDGFRSDLGGGVRMQQNISRVRMALQYGLSGLALTSETPDGKSEIRHSAGIGVVLFPDHDEVAPLVSVQTDRSVFSPEQRDGLPGYVHFQLRARENTSRFQAWHLVIYKAGGTLEAESAVRRFHGKGMPPQILRWNGEGNTGEPLEKGAYAYRLIVLDEAGNVGKSGWQNIEIR